MQQDNKPASHYIHRTSYSFQEQIVGIFVLSAVIVMLALLFTLLKKQNIFEDYFIIYGRLNSAAGLSKETSVQISGFEVGRVSKIEITDNNDILITLSIARRYQKLIRTDSQIKISSLNTTIIGRSIINITAGSPDKDIIAEGVEFRIQESASIEHVISEALTAMETLTGMVQDVSHLVSAVQPETISQALNSIRRTADNLEQLSRRLVSGEGLVGSMVYDDQLVEQVNESILNLQKSTRQLNELLAKFNSGADQIPEIMLDVQTVLDETEQTVDAAQRVWPISSAMSKENKTTIVNPLPAND